MKLTLKNLMNHGLRVINHQWIIGRFNLTFVSSFNDVPYPNPCLKNFQAPGNFNFDKTDHAGLADDLMHTD